MFSIPLTYLYHVNEGLGVLISSQRGIELRNRGIGTLIRHGVDQNRKDLDGKVLEKEKFSD